MRISSKIHVLSIGLLVTATTQGQAQGPVGVAPSPAALTTPTPTPTPAPAPRPSSVKTSRTTPKARVAAGPSSYWGPAPSPVPPKKPNAVRRLFNRVGGFLGADEEMGTTQSYRDVTTGRTNTINTKPWMKQNK